MQSRQRRLILLGLITAAVAALGLAVPPVPQWESYHAFADRRAFMGVPNFQDVVSNALFTLVGLAGLHRLVLAARRPHFLDPRERWPWLGFFLALVLLGAASAWYHLDPSNDGLFWDRLAMTAVFMSWLAAQIVERIGVRAGLMAYPFLLAAGAASVFYWIASEHAGAGDLRAYGFVQFYPALLIPLLMALFPPRYTRSQDTLLVLGVYGAALGMEWLDRWLFGLTGWVSGHTVKHLLAALAVYWVLRMLVKRRPVLWSGA